MTMLIREGIQAGVWRGILTCPEPPDIEVLHGGQALENVSVAALSSGRHAIEVPIPVELLEDGVQTFVIRELQEGTTLGHFSIATGGATEDDLRAEIDLLRAELDLLKRAFRRHCLEAEMN